MELAFISHPKDPRFRDITGHQFEHLTVLGLADKRGGRFRWHCRCSCGTLVTATAKNLQNGHRKSCGCSRKKHGHCHGPYERSPEYTSWQNSKQRCINPNTPYYARYGGRGIRMCDRWLNSFEAFLADMGPKPSPRHQIDRIDTDGNYEPGNCCWATNMENSAHTSRSVLVTYEGETCCLSEWARRFNLNVKTLEYRIRAGWPVEKAMTTPGRSGT